MNASLDLAEVVALCTQGEFIEMGDVRRLEGLYRQGKTEFRLQTIAAIKQAVPQEKWPLFSFLAPRAPQYKIEGATRGTGEHLPEKEAGSRREPEAPPVEFRVAETPSTMAEAAAILGAVTWAWQGWLPNDMLTMLVGDQEAGKSMLSLSIAGCFLRGDPWPDGSPFTGETGKVLLVETESALPMFIERMRKWGLPMGEVVLPFADSLRSADLNSPDDLNAIANAHADPQVKFTSVDSLSGGNSINEKDDRMMCLMRPLAQMVQGSKKPLMVNHHLRKRTIMDVGDQGVSLARVRGSTTIPQLARAVWAIDVPNPIVTTRRLAMIKLNLAIKPAPLGFTITDTGVVFTGDAPEELAAISKVQGAADFLRDILANGPIPQKRIEAEAEASSIPTRTLARAKKILGIKSSKTDTGWEWELS